MKTTKLKQIGLASSAALLGVLAGCIGYVEEPHHARVYAPAPTVYVEAGVSVHDDYVYYPGYEVYYSSSRRQYVYLEGRSWVTRPAPPHVSVDVLFASPSVRLDFHDSPSAHHSTIVRQYPKHWAPPGQSHGKGKDDRDDGKGKGR